MSGGLPTVLAAAGTALMAVAMFGPFRKPPEATAQWPALVEETALACDARARIDLADALGALQTPWAESILRQAHATERDPDVRAAIAQALSSSQCFVT